MNLSAIVRAMVNSGCTPEQICAAVEAHEAEREEKVAARRRKDAERKRRSRAGMSNMSEMSRNVTRTPADSADKKKVSPTPPSKKNISPPSPPMGGIPPTKNRGPTLCAPDWQPKAKTVETLRAEGHSADAIDRGKSEMIDWSQAGGKRKHDWDATLRNWVRRNNKPRNNSPPDKHARLKAAFAETRKDYSL